ncbi:MAG: hypothetical protein ACK5U7_14695 [Bacteroidota bacterium]
MKKHFLQCLLIITMLSFGLGIGSCRKEQCHDPQNPECENYDPCWGKLKPSANFLMTFHHPWGGPIDEKYLPEYCDTIIGAGATFVADYSNAVSYTWKIGTDTRSFTGRKINVDFSKYVEDPINNLQSNKQFYNPIEIILSVKLRKSECNPYGDTTLVKKKKLVFAVDNGLYGKYLGRVEGESSDRVIEIFGYTADFDRWVNDLLHRGRTAIVNLPNLLKKDTIRIIKHAIPYKLTTFKNFIWDSESDEMYEPWKFTDPPRYYILDGINFAHFYIDRQPDGRNFITLKYKSVDLNKNVKWFTFKGKEIL